MKTPLVSEICTALRGLREDAADCLSPARLARILAEIAELEAELARIVQ